MFAIAVELLTGRYTATQFNDRGRPEWPPHPARVFSAMVATWADNETPCPVEQQALRWLESQSPPSLCCGDGKRREVVTHFVPVNDPIALTRDISRSYTTLMAASQALQEAIRAGNERAADRARRGLAAAETKAVADAARAGTPTGRESDQVVSAVLQVLPEHRGKQGRTYPTVIPDERVIWFVWSGAKPSSEDRNALDGLLARVARIGHSSTMVACRVDASPPSPTWVPGTGRDGHRLRVPRTGLMNRLELAFASHRGVEPRTLPAGMIDYRRPAEPRLNPATPLLGGDWYMLGLSERRPPAATRSLAIARAVRSALLAHGQQPPPEIVSGHRQPRVGYEHPTPPLERPHLAIVPLPSVGHRHSDGAVRGVALVLPAGCSDHDRAVLECAVGGWRRNGNLELTLAARPGGNASRFVLEDLGYQRADGRGLDWADRDMTVARRSLTRGFWCRPAWVWRTVTPIALDRFPGNLRSHNPQQRVRAEAEATAAVARACGFAGLPEPVEVTIRLDAPLAGVPAPPSSRRRVGHQYPGYLTGRGVPRVCVHAVIEFAEPVRGPVLVGAGRYFGYGLCLPDAPREAR